MADDVAITEGAGKVVATDDCGGRQVQLNKLAIATDGSATLIPADATNGLRVTPSIRHVRLTGTPTISTSPAYSINDQVGGVVTFTGAALTTGGTGTIISAVITARWANTVVPSLDLYLFEVSPTLVNADNGAFNITDADLETARVCGVINFLTGNYEILANNVVCPGTAFSGAPIVPFITATTANLFGVFVARTTFTAAGTTDIQATLRIAQDS